MAKQITAEHLGLDSTDVEVAAVPEKEATEQAYNTDQVQELARTSLDFLAALALPTVFKYLFCKTFVAIWSWLITSVHKVRDFSQLAIGLPRGFGKTMLIKIFVLYCILFTKKQFILVICGTQTKANNIITDIASMLSEQNIKKVFGDWSIGLETDRQDLKRFGFRGRNIILMGAGAESDIRGITLENVRPDVMIFDDIQTREDADSMEVSAKIETWMVGTAMKAKSPEGCLYVFIANMYPTKWSILRKLKHNPTWTSFIAGGIVYNEQTGQPESLWEELQPIKQLLQEYENDVAMGRGEIFHAEVLNDENASVNRLIDINAIPDDPFEGDTHQGNFIIVDPSNDKHNSDAVSLIYFEVFDGKPVSKEIIEGRLSPGAANWEAIKLCLKYNCRLVAWESNAYQYSGLYWFNYQCQQYGITGIQCVPVYSGTRSKNARIGDLFKSLMAKEQYLGKDTRAQTFAQITPFNPLKTNNVDGILDCHAYALKCLEEYGEYISSTIDINIQDTMNIPVRSEYETASF